MIENFERHPLIHPQVAHKLLQVFPQGLVCFDLETTGLSPMMDKIIELSAIKITPSGVSTFSTLINPAMSVPAHSTAIHGINDLMLVTAPSVAEVMPAFCQFINGLPIIAHNAKFDSGFIAMACHQLELELPRNLVYCSLLLSKKVFSELSSHRLAFLVKELNIPLANHHRALDDSIACLILVAHCLAKSSFDEGKLEASLLFKLSDYSQLNSFDIPEALKGINDKIGKRHLIFIKYRSGSYKNQFRPILPTSFLPMPGGHILYALCLHTGLYKSFGLNKIQEWKEMNSDELAIWAKELTNFDKKSNS